MKLETPLIMGIVNITPDSFSDGGCFLKPELACEQVERLCEEGAGIIDLGAESTRPGSKRISAEEEWSRLEPVLSLLEKKNFPGLVSIDTGKPEVMRRAATWGAHYINDVFCGADDETLRVLAAKGMSYIAMHMRGTPETMQNDPLQGSEACQEVGAFFVAKRQHLLALGFKEEKIWLDPGIGFGKSDAANWQLLQQAREFASRYNLVVGISRKSFLGRFLAIPDPLQRHEASQILELGLVLAGVQMIRTHEVKILHKLKQVCSQ